MTIGHVLPITTRHEIVNPIFSDFLAGAGEVYAANGYQMMLSVVEDGDEARAYRRMKTRGSVDGVILHAPRMDDPRIALMHELELPFAVHGRASLATLPYSWLDVNNRSAFRRAAEFLLDFGHRRIGLINGLEEMDFAFRRRAGYIDALAARGIVADPALMRADEMTEGYGYRSAADMLDGAAPPSAFLVSSIISALGARRAIEERGLRLGRDVSLITFDDVLSYLANSGEIPVFTAARSSVREAGRALAEMLLRRIAAPDTPHESRLLEAELTLGRSTGPAPA